MSHDTAIYIYVIVSLIIITILAVFLYKSKNESYSHESKKNKIIRDKCICSGGGNKLCANRAELLASYLKGNTEYQDFSKNQKNVGGPFWHSTDFNKY